MLARNATDSPAHGGLRWGMAMTIRGGDVPYLTMAATPTERMGSPPRSFAPMRMSASWFGPLCDPPYTRLRRDDPRPTASSPRTRAIRPSADTSARHCSNPAFTGLAPKHRLEMPHTRLGEVGVDVGRCAPRHPSFGTITTGQPASRATLRETLPRKSAPRAPDSSCWP